MKQAIAGPAPSLPARPQNPGHRMAKAVLVAACLGVWSRSLEADQPVRFFPRNTSVPFCYVQGGARSWQIVNQSLPKGSSVQLTASQGDRSLGSGVRLKFSGLTIFVGANGKLNIVSKGKSKPLSFSLEARLQTDKKSPQRQTLRIRQAPPDRPISYVSDLVDDLIRIFWDSGSGRYRPLTRDAFDQHFRRLQAHGVSRLIVWQSPFPLMPDPAEFAPSDWQRYRGQATAIISNRKLSQELRESGKLESWTWLTHAMSLRLNPEFGRLFTQSAADHGIKLTASFRPFEHALAKYYEVPVFDSEGSYLWGFSPAVSPAVNYHPDKVGFAHYRTLLRASGVPAASRLASLEWHGLRNAATLVKRFKEGKRDVEVVASSYPPLDSKSWVLVRGPGDQFRLERFATVRAKAASRQTRLKDYRLEIGSDGSLKISGITIPKPSLAFVSLRAVSDYARSMPAPANLRITLRAEAGNRLGRTNTYWALDEKTEAGRQTRVAGILPGGGFRAEFQATENSISHLVQRGKTEIPWADNEAVVNMGRPWSTEMVDFNQAAARAYAVAQLRTLLKHRAFDEILINTRSHTQLAASMGETSGEIETIYKLRQKKYRATGYRSAGRTYIGLGIDRAYTARNAAELPEIRKTLGRTADVEKLTTWQPGEWQATCQSDKNPFVWRFARNKTVASGVRRLLLDLERTFPDTRIRIVLPQRAAVDKAMERGLSQMRKADGKTYGADFFRHVWSTNNYIPTIGEGLCMLNLRGLGVEPVFLGIRFAPDDGPLKLFVERCLIDMKDNRGSRFRGPRSFFYEAQETMRAADRARFKKRREVIIRYLLSKKDDIGEVLLYESADWMYYLPIDDPHRYLDSK